MLDPTPQLAYSIYIIDLQTSRGDRLRDVGQIRCIFAPNASIKKEMKRIGSVLLLATLSIHMGAGLPSAPQFGRRLIRQNDPPSTEFVMARGMPVVWPFVSDGPADIHEQMPVFAELVDAGLKACCAAPLAGDADALGTLVFIRFEDRPFAPAVTFTPNLAPA